MIAGTTLSKPGNRVIEIDKSHVILPGWLEKDSFVAKTTLIEKITRVFNNLIFGSIVCNLCRVIKFSGRWIIAGYFTYGYALCKIISIVIGFLVFPVALRTKFGEKGEMIAAGREVAEQFKKKGFIVKNISLFKSGVAYDANIISHPSIFNNGKWTINALGNNAPMDYVMDAVSVENFKHHFNTLVINGPAAGKSGGMPTRYQFGAGFEAGLQFLEQEVKATHIIMHGVSLGGGNLSEAVLQHDFNDGLKRNTKYLFISHCTFSKLSKIAHDLEGSFVKPFFLLSGMELDSVKAAKKLSQLNVSHIVIQHKGNSHGDGVVSKAVSLANSLRKDPTMKKKIFLESDQISHNDELPPEIQSALKQEITEFCKH